MPVYPAAARISSCSSDGCWCRDRVPCYPSDLSDEQWAVLEPQARAVMAELTAAAGRPMVPDLRAMCDAVAYVTRNGIEWRAVPADFPPWDSVYEFYRRWNARGLPQGLAARLRGRLREHQGRSPEPTACIIDSQIVKCADTAPAATSGYHGGKKIKGRGRHLIVDTEGWPLALAVTAASVSDKVLRGAEDADESGVHDADGNSGESGGVVGEVSATSARCRDDGSCRADARGWTADGGRDARQRACGGRERRGRISLPGTGPAAGPGSAP